MCCMWGADAGGARPARPGAFTIEEMLEAAKRHPDVFIPFVWVDVWRDDAGAAEARRLIEAGAKGFKFHPPTGGYYANDQRLYELYEVIAAAKLPALFHTGQTAVGQGAGAGGGVRLKYGNPIYLDDVAVDLPAMPIDNFWSLAAKSPEKLAIVDNDERQYTNAEVLARVNRLSHGLRSLGLQRGDSIAAMLPNSHEAMEVFLAMQQIGLYLTPMN